MTYAEKLKDPRWQRLRLEVMQAADFQCEDCGAKDKTLSVHHKKYVWGRKPWEYKPEELSCNCQPCHQRRHDLLEKINKGQGTLGQLANNPDLYNSARDAASRLEKADNSSNMAVRKFPFSTPLPMP